MTPPKPISANPSPTADIGDMHGLRLSSAPNLQNPASLRTIPLGPNAIGDTIHGGKPRDQWLANLDRRLAHIQRGHQPGHPTGSQAHAARYGSLGTHVARAPQLRTNGQGGQVRPARGNPTSTAGTVTSPENRRPIILGSRRHPLSLSQIRSKVNDGPRSSDGTVMPNRGSLRNGDAVYFRNSQGIVLCGRISLNDGRHTIHLSPAIGPQDQAGKQRPLTLSEAMRRATQD